MKKIIIITMFALLGCKKETPTPAAPTPPPVNCRCGYTISQGGTYTIEGRQTEWWYQVRNYCTNAPIFIRVLRPIDNGEYCKDYQW